MVAFILAARLTRGARPIRVMFVRGLLSNGTWTDLYMSISFCRASFTAAESSCSLVRRPIF